MQSSHNVTVSFAVEQMDKGQDEVCAGQTIDVVTGEPCEWVMLNDGHGSNSCIDGIRQTTQNQKSDMIGKADPITALANHIDSSGFVGPNEKSGSTAVIAKVYGNRAECINCGDSQYMVFRGNDLVFVSKEHNCNNADERNRVTAMNGRFQSSTAVKPINGGTTLMSIPAEYAVFPYGPVLASTQALGHNSRTGYAPDHQVFEFEPGVQYRIVMGSDGLFDMAMLDDEADLAMLRNGTSREITDWIVGRWLQTWEGVLPDGTKVNFKYTRNQCDDVSVAVIDVVPY